MTDILKSKKSKLFLLLICISTLSMSIGYAAMNGISMEISGTITSGKQEGIFITDVICSGTSSGGYSVSCNYIQSILISTVELAKTSATSSVTYQITIFNGYDETYKFSNVIYDESYYDNNDITYSLSGLQSGDKLESGGSVTFFLTFSYANNTISSNNTLNSYLNFVFEEKTIKVASSSELLSALSSGEENISVELIGDITDLSSPISITSGNITIDLNGYSLGSDSLEYTSDNSLINVSGNANVTIQDTSGTATLSSNRIGVYSTSSGTVIIDGVNINVTDDCAIRNYGSGTIIVKNSTVVSTNWAGINNRLTGLVQVYNSSITGYNYALKNDGGGTIEVYSGKFTYEGTSSITNSAMVNTSGTVNVSGGSFNDTSFTGYLVSGYTYTTNSEGYYEVTQE